MYRYLKMHEQFISRVLAAEWGEVSWPELQHFHEQQIRYLQHERLVHLLVTLFIAVFALLAVGFTATQPGWAAGLASLLLLILLAAYVLHYFRLENGVQRWYHLANQIAAQCEVVSARYDTADIQPGLGRRAETKPPPK